MIDFFLTTILFVLMLTLTASVVMVSAAILYGIALFLLDLLYIPQSKSNKTTATITGVTIGKDEKGYTTCTLSAKEPINL